MQVSCVYQSTWLWMFKRWMELLILWYILHCVHLIFVLLPKHSNDNVNTDSDWIVMYLDHICLLLNYPPSTGHAAQNDYQREIKQINCLKKRISYNNRQLWKTFYEMKNIIITRSSSVEMEFFYVKACDSSSRSHECSYLNGFCCMYALCSPIFQNPFSLSQPCQLKLVKLCFFIVFNALLSFFDFS